MTDNEPPIQEELIKTIVQAVNNLGNVNAALWTAGQCTNRDFDAYDDLADTLANVLDDFTYDPSAPYPKVL